MDNVRVFLPSVNIDTDVLKLLRNLVCDSNAEEFRTTPSRFMSEMLLTTEERLEKMKSPINVSKTPSTYKIFEPMPRTVVFQNFKPGVIYSTSFSIRNNDKIPRPLRPIFAASPYFRVTYASESISTHIAPGIAIQFNIKFSAEDLKDYKHDLTFVTEGETFVVAVYALRPRPLLDLPDCIKLPDSVIRVPSETATFVRNLGKVPAIFFASANQPFSVNPSKGIVQPGERMKLTVQFKTNKLGNVEDQLLVTYDSGEVLLIKLLGYAENASISLEKGSIHFHQTFIGLMRERKITLSNNSKFIINFRWKFYSTTQEEMKKIQKIKDSLESLKKHETFKSTKLQEMSVIDAGGHANIYDRIYVDELQELEHENLFPYQNPHFQIVPLTGDIWPNAKMDFTIFFSPTHVEKYLTHAYLDTTGRNQRIRLMINGHGIGPCIELNMDTLDANTLYMCSVHQYEVVAMNKGDIPGIVTFAKTDLEFGGTISCDPYQIRLKPNECGRFIITFSSRQQGHFFEELLFSIEDSPDVLRLIFKGEIICPYLSFDVYELDFGTVPIGYPVRRKLVMSNNSMVSISYKFSVQGDGDIPAITCQEYAFLPIKCGLNKRPREFDYSRRNGHVPPNSSLTTELTLTANLLRQCTTSLIVKIWDSDRHTTFLPIKFKASIPKLVSVPSEINIRFCFVHYPYHRTLILRNESDLPGYVEINTSTQSELEGITCTTSTSASFVQPHHDVEINLVVTTSVLGDDRSPIFIKLLGGQWVRCCTLYLRGQGPVVTPSVEDIDFGNVKMLNWESRELTISNDSPIAAAVKLQMPPKSLFTINPKEFTLEMEQSQSVQISIYLTDPVRIHDKLFIDVQDGNNAEYTVRAKGVGTSILCEPSIEPKLNLGVLMTYQEFSFSVSFTNKGKKGHKMLWSRNKHLKALRESTEEAAPSVFCIVPNLMELVHDQQITTLLKGYATKPSYVTEDFYCHAVLEKSTVQEIIMTCNVSATFVEPCVELSKTDMKFFKNIGAEASYQLLMDEVTITNKSHLPVGVNVVATKPFCIEMDEKEMHSFHLLLEHEESRAIVVKFKPSSTTNRCYVVQEKLKLNYGNHPKIDIVHLLGEVNFPCIEMYPRAFNFSCLPPNATSCYDVVIKNVSPLQVTYCFEWQEAFFRLNHVEGSKIRILTKKVQECEDRTDSGMYLEKLEMIKRESNQQNAVSSELLLQVIDLENAQLPEEESVQRLPLIYYYQNAYREEYQMYHYVQLHDTLRPSVSMSDSLSYPERNLDYFLEMRSLLYGAIVGYDEREFGQEAVKSLGEDQCGQHVNTKMLGITPSRGVLQPYESQMVSVVFQPLNNTTIFAQAQCHILKGDGSVLSIEGRSSELSYSVETDYIDFGRQVFCEIIEKTITLKNTCRMRFDFCASAREPKQIVSSVLLEAGCLTITPQYGKLLPGESTKLRIQYMPGIAGEFNETFSLKVGYLPKISIDVHGYGDFPQVYLGVRPSFKELPPKITYLAISGLTSQYLKSLKNLNYLMRNLHKEECKEDLPKKEVKLLRKLGWAVISYSELYPSGMDIDLAIERVILYHHIYDYPSVLSRHTKVHKATVVPEFTVPEYFIDFGNVILGDKVTHKIDVFNYGPTIAFVKATSNNGKGLQIDIAGLQVNFSQAIIEVGRCKEFFIDFSPTPEAYKVVDCDIQCRFYLDVAHGPRIPLHIKAVVTAPGISVNVSQLNFGDVRCGNIKKRSLVLTNSGCVQCTYQAMIKPKEQKRANKNVEPSASFNKYIFFLNQAKNLVKSGDQCLLDVFFEPQFDGVVEWVLVISVDKNPHKKHISLKGYGQSPQLKIIDDVVKFDPVLPYILVCTKIFRIKNVSSIPVEFAFADYDLAIEEEERIINLVAEFYSLEQFTVPPRKPGQALPMQVQRFYNEMVEDLNKKLIKISIKNMEDNHNNSLSGSIVTLCSGKRRSSSKKKSISTKSDSMDLSHANFATSLLPKDREELEGLLRDHVRNMSQEEKLKTDPLHDAIAEYKELYQKKVPPSVNEGVYIIFHGSYTTSYVRAANRAGLELGVQVYSIDQLLIESVADSETTAAQKVKALIDEEYKLIPQSPNNSKESIPTSYDAIEIKINSIIHGKDKIASTPKKDPRKDKKSQEESKSTFLGISEELLLELVKQKLLTLKDGVVIESLNSIFLKKPVAALTLLLRAIGNVRYIHCIVLSYTFREYVTFQEELSTLQEMEETRKREEKLAEMIDMNADQLKALSPSDYSIYVNHILKNRRQCTIAKRENLKKRLWAAKAAKVIVIKKVDKKTGSTKSSYNHLKPADSKKATSVVDLDKGDLNKGKLTPPESHHKSIFDKFEADLSIMTHLLELWDRRTCVLVKPVPVPLAAKDAKPKHLNDSTTHNLNVHSKLGIARSRVVFSQLSPEEDLKLLQTGVPCWIVQNAHTDKPVETMITTYLKRTGDLHSARLALKETTKKNIEESIELRTCLRAAKPPRIKSLSDVFILKDMPVCVEAIAEHPKQGKSKSPGFSLKSAEGTSPVKSGKRSKSGKASTVTSAQSEVNPLDATLTTRTVLNPGESAKYCVLYKPEKVGDFEHTFTIEVTGWPATYYLTCQGSCCIPQLNMEPESLFPKVLKRRTRKTMYHNCIFLKDVNVFDFGPLLLHSKVESSVLAAETEFNFTNNSLIPCDISFSIRNNPNAFEFDKETLVVQPQTTEVLNVRALPILGLETINDQLIISIKDNPMPSLINLNSECCKLNFAIHPKLIRFEHVLLNAMKEREVIMENHSKVAVSWQLMNLEKISKNFTITPLQGYIEPMQSQKMVVQFQSPTKVVIRGQSIHIEVYDKDYKSFAPLHNEAVDVTAEAIEVSIQCLKQLNLKELKGHTEHILLYEIMANGKYNVEFFFSKVRKEQDPHYKQNKTVRNYFSIAPSSGLLQPLKPFEAKIQFFATSQINVKEVPIINVTFVDPLVKTIIETFPLTVTVQTEFSIYELCPPEQINFGYQLIGSTNLQTMTILNRGKFEFEYNILSLQHLLEQRTKQTIVNKKEATKESEAKTKKGGKSDNSYERKEGKLAQLDIGYFSLTSASGFVQPGAAVGIDVTAIPKQLGVFEEDLVIFISEADDEDGRQFKLSVTSLLPTVNFTDFDGIFREQFVVNSMEEIGDNAGTDSQAIFIKDEEHLHFPRVMINTEATARIRLENVSPVTAELVAVVTSSGDNVFSVTPTKFNVDAYSTAYLSVTFFPHSIDTINGELYVHYHGLDALKQNSFHIKLSGEGLIPEIALLRPEFDVGVNCYSINFPPTYIDDTSSNCIEFENVGVVPSQIIIEVCDGNLDVFRLIPHYNTKPLLKVRGEVVQTTVHTNLVFLDVREKGEFYLQFKPSSSGAFNCIVKLHLVNNPFETFTILVTAEGYTGSVIIKDLLACGIKSKSSEEELINDIGYLLDFGQLAVNKPHKVCFKIMNKSSSDAYKFEFTNWDKVVFIPSKGHLKPNAGKDIIVMFASRETSSILKRPIHCTVYKIEYVTPQLEALSWDERQTVVVWEPTEHLHLTDISEVNLDSENIIDMSASCTSALKMVREKGEPLINIVPETTRHITLLVSVICDYASFECSIEEINMEDTLAFEASTQTVEVRNTSTVLLELEWNIQIKEYYPIRSNSGASNEADLDNRPLQSQNQALASRRCVKNRPVHLTGKESFFPNENHLRASTNSSLFSSRSNYSSGSVDSWMDGGNLPIAITPSFATIDPMGKQEFTVTFAPKDVFQCLVHIKSSIANLKPSLKQLDIVVKAKSLLPLYYFETVPSDYISRRKGSGLCGDLVDNNTTVVEFDAIGLGITVTRSFNVVNPTSEHFTYTWRQAQASTKDVSLFHCHRTEGLVEKGKKTEARFSFMPPRTGTFETFYIFHLEQYNASKTFLMVGTAREPVINFSTPYLQMRPSVLGLDMTDYTILKNTENFEIDFQFKKESLYSDAHHQVLTVEPLKGILEPNGEKEIKITFHPVKVGEVQFNLQCTVTRMKNPLVLTVTGSCYEIQPFVFYETTGGQKITLDANVPQIMELKSLVPLLPQENIFTIVNIGMAGFYYTWSVKDDVIGNKINIVFQDNEGYVPVSSETTTKMCLTPLTKVTIKKLIMKLEIRYGPTYTIYITGATSLALFSFSKNEYDFGTCLVQKEATQYYKAVVEFNNADVVPITLECNQPEEDFITVNFKSKRIKPKKIEPIVVHFHPTKIQRYYVEVTFYINSRSHVLRFRGEGVANSIILVNSNDKFLNLGSVPIGKISTTVVNVFNNGNAYVDIIFDLRDRLPYYSRPSKMLTSEYVGERTSLSPQGSFGNTKMEKTRRNNDQNKNGKNNKKDMKRESITVSKRSKVVVAPDETERELIRKFVSFSPKKFTRVAPQQCTQFVITYAPTERMKGFTEKVAYQVQDIVETLCTFKGSCVGADYVLDKEFIPFGCVTLGYSNKQKAMLNNVGDVGGTFKWTFEKPQPYFTITPDNGYISPNTTVVFSVQFTPSSLGNLFKEKIKCQISNFKKPLEIVLTGSCINMPAPTDYVTLECAVRESAKQYINVANTSLQTCKVSTTINGQYFTSKDIFTIKPKSTLPCEVFYSPMTMTEYDTHKATIFFAFPEGQGILYSLIGTTKPPTVVEKIYRVITCKTLHHESLTVKNWLKLPQTFEVITENINHCRILYKLVGNSTIEVLGQSQRTYTWSVNVLNEGVLQLKVMFKNKETGEYLFYEIALTVLKCPPLDVITLSTCVRHPVTHILTLENPLKHPVTYTIKPSVPELVYHSSEVVQPLSQFDYAVTYNPLAPGVIEARVEITSSDVGSYPYDFKLVAHPPIPETQTTFVAKLGQTVTQKVFLTNSTKNTTTFEVQFLHPDEFYLDGPVTVGPEAKKGLLIYFEPTAIGSVKSSLALNSAVAGSYLYSLVGVCEVPKPQGPYFIVPGTSAVVPFKNPFVDATDFVFVVEPAIFSVKNPTQSINGKTETNIQIYLVPLRNLEILIDRKYSITGKLTVHPVESRVSHIKWIYYLQGDLTIK